LTDQFFFTNLKFYLDERIVFFADIDSMSGAIQAQSARDSVMAAVNNLFEGMKRADTILLKNCFSANAVMQTIQDNKGSIKVSNESVADFIAFVGKEAVGAAHEKIMFETIKIDGTLATVWTPYKFYYKGKFSHCGVNSFQLVRLNSG